MKTLDNPNSFDTFSLINTIVGVFSLIGYIVVYYKILSNQKKYSGHLFHLLMLHMTPSILKNIFFYLGLFLPEKCDYEATGIVFVDLSILMWNMILVIETYQYFSFHSKMNKKKLVIYCVFGYVIPIVSALLMLELKFYGKTHYLDWCWIDTKWMAWTYLAVLFLSYLFNIYIFILAKKQFKENIVDDNQTNSDEKYFLITRFALIQIVSFFFSMTKRTLNLLLTEISFLEFINSLVFNSLVILYILIFYFNYRDLKEDINDQQIESLIENDF